MPPFWAQPWGLGPGPSIVTATAWDSALVFCLHFSTVKTNYFVGIYPQSDADSLFPRLLSLLNL